LGNIMDSFVICNHKILFKKKIITDLHILGQSFTIRFPIQSKDIWQEETGKTTVLIIKHLD